MTGSLRSVLCALGRVWPSLLIQTLTRLDKVNGIYTSSLEDEDTISAEELVARSAPRELVWPETSPALSSAILAAMVCIVALGHELTFRPDEVVQESIDNNKNNSCSLSSRRRSVQGLSLAFRLLVGLDYTCVVPNSYDLVEALGGGAALSGVFIALSPISFLVGYFLLGLLPESWDHWARRQMIVFGMFATGLLSLCYAVLLSTPGLEDWPWLIWAVFGLRFLAGVSIGLSYVCFLLGLEATSEAEMVTFSLMDVTLGGLGFSLGPMFSSAALWARGGPSRSSSVFEISAAPFFPLALIYLTFAVLFSWILPRPLSAIIPAKVSSLSGADERKTMMNDAEPSPTGSKPSVDEPQLSDADRKLTMLACTAYALERGVTMGSLEATTAAILEVEFHWPVGAVGFATGLSMGGAAVLGFCIMLMLRWHPTLDNSFVERLTYSACLGTLGLFKLAAFDGPLKVLLADVIIYACASNAFGMMNAFAFKSAFPDGLYSKPNYLLAMMLCCELGRFVGLCAGRGLLVTCGRNAYAVAQLVITLLGCLSVSKVLTLQQK